MLCVSFQEYGLCEEWGCLYPIPRECLISLHQKHLLHLLERGDHEKALQVSFQLFPFFFWEGTKRLAKSGGFVLNPMQSISLSDPPLHVLQEPEQSSEQKVPTPALGARWAAGSRTLLNSGPVKAIICEATGVVKE